MSNLRLTSDRDRNQAEPQNSFHAQQYQHAAAAGSAAGVAGRDRRQHRRHDLEQQDIAVERWDGGAGPGGSRRRRQAVAGPRAVPAALGQILDLSAGGVRIRTSERGLRPDHQVRVRLELPAFAGISPFVDTTGPDPRPSRQWVGWMTVTRVQPVPGAPGSFDVAGRLVDMEDLDRGMLGLYLSTQPLAA